jgi:hypothetical protein
MPTSQKVAVPREADLLSQDSHVIEQDEEPVADPAEPAANPAEAVDNIGGDLDDLLAMREKSKSVPAAATAVSTVEYVVDALPIKPDFHTIHPKREKMKGMVDIAATAKGAARHKTYVTTANQRILKLESTLNLERGYSDALVVEGRRIFTNMHTQMKGFHTKLGAALKKSAELSASISSLTKENKDLANALSAAEKREGVLKGQVEKAQNEAAKAVKQVTAAKAKKTANEKPVSLFSIIIMNNIIHLFNSCCFNSGGQISIHSQT